MVVSRITAVTEHELNTLREKVHVYEQFLHQLQLFAEVVLDNKKTSALISNACRWSYAHRVGNGTLSDEEQHQLIEKAFNNLLKHD
jgi:ribosome-associated translation inhibitor RaiA